MDQGLFSIPLSGTMPPMTIPKSWSQPMHFTSWTGPALTMSSTGVVGTSRDTTPRTRIMEGLFGPPFPYSQCRDYTDSSSSRSGDF